MTKPLIESLYCKVSTIAEIIVSLSQSLTDAAKPWSASGKPFRAAPRALLTEATPSVGITRTPLQSISICAMEDLGIYVV
jgi:hypothetical protein